MNMLKYKLILIFLIIPLISKSQDYYGFIQKIQSYQDAVRLEKMTAIDSSTFNIKTYLSFFDNININDDYKIDVFFLDFFTGGYPLLYAHKESENIGDMDKATLRAFLKRKDISAKYHISPKDSKIGFLQYLFFATLGENFALKWHSNIGIKRIIYSSDNLNNEIHKLKTSDMFSTDSLELVKLKDVSPKIKIKKQRNYYIVSWLENRTHFGIYRCSYKVDRNKPYSIEKIKEERVLKIDMNFIY
ncbi:MAG: hypothetical protein CVU12_01875 [Bacteroidetes bacterium HGW-Bacteroidetes-7]|jgi:hypothetical protein|nr:MAG: hypothetical protein CVU12_01875 [Bacteroidetes bacterium HGW-Bacteroidetes-7]